MNLKKISYLLIHIFIILFCSKIFATTQEIAITFDDLPSALKDSSLQEQKYFNHQLLTILKKYQIPSIGFVNEGKLYAHPKDTQAKIEILKEWVSVGQNLGNHTYSHLSLNSTNLQGFEKDVLKGEKISKTLMKEAKKEMVYFRYPFLDEAISSEQKKTLTTFLNSHGYIEAPITIDTSDWRFNRAYKTAITNNKIKEAQEIKQKYLIYTNQYFDFIEMVTQNLFNRPIKHIWLLHDNLLNADAIEELIKLLQKRGYRFVSLDEALKDDIYKLPTNFFKRKNVGLLYKLNEKYGEKINWAQAPNPQTLLSNINVY